LERKSILSGTPFHPFQHIFSMKKATSFFLFSLLFSTAAFSQTWTSDKAHTKLGFTLVHLGLSEVDGAFRSVDAKITASKEDFSDAVFELTADVKTVTTSNDMRDGHLQKPDMFDTEKFPTLTFKSTSIVKTGDKTYKLTGDLSIKGVTKSVTLDLTLMGTGENPRNQKKMVGFKATGSIKRTDFGVGSMPTLMVSEEVLLRASGEFVKD
jgi:polyisoprenoid-binding protein YceI